MARSYRLPIPFAALLVVFLGRTCAADTAAREPTCAAPVADGSAPEGTTAVPSKLALLVAIDEYAQGSGRLRPLHGAKNDVRRVRELLIDRFGFAPENVRLLLDADATVEAFVRAFDEHLIQRAEAETEVLFWFSGHGSRVPDLSGRGSAETDEHDNTLVLWDSRSEGRDGEYDLSDDLLAGLLHALCERTPRVTLVTDCCYSGGVTRSTIPSRVRALSKGRNATDHALFESFWPPAIAHLDDAPAARAESRYVHVGACYPTQQALEIDVDDQRVHGALSWFLTAELARAQPSTTYRRLVADATARLGARVVGQRVWLEGANLDRVLFSGRFEERPPGIPARLHGHDVTIEAGTLSGIDCGVELAIHAGQAAEPLGRVRVVKANATQARARWVDDPPLELPERALRAVLASLPTTCSPLVVHVADDALAAVLARSPWVEIEPERAPADYVLEADADGGWALTHADLVWTSAAADALAWLDRVLRKEAHYRAALAWSARPGKLDVVARLRPPTAAELEDLAEIYVAADLDPDGVGGFRASGVRADEAREVVVLEVFNPGPHDLYVHVFSLTEDRTCCEVWPSRPDARLVPGEGQPILIDLSIEAGTWPHERARLDRLLVLATAEPASFEHLEQEGIVSPEREATRGAAPSPSPPNRVDGAFGVRTIDVWVD